MLQDATTQARLQTRIQPVLTLLERHRVVDAVVDRQTGPRKDLVAALTHRQQLSELRQKLQALHAAEIAYLLDRLPPEDRLLIWNEVPDDRGGDVLWETSDAVLNELIAATDRDRLLSVLRRMDADGLSFLSGHVPDDVLHEASQSLEAGQRSWLQSSINYPEDSVGRLMSSEIITIDETATVRHALKALRARGGLPHQADQLFVVDQRRRLKGVLPLTSLLLHSPRGPVAALAKADALSFTPWEDAKAAAQAFERYDLISAPVVDESGRIVGRLTVDAVMDFLRKQAEEEALKREGLAPDADLFAPIGKSVRARWLWLAVNLLTAFLASRVIGLFEGTIERLVALATLMPIVASIGGNTGNQTIALLVRALAINQIRSDNLRYIVLKEIAVSLVNGAVWGSVMGVVAVALYQNLALGAVMAAATLLNLVVAALVGIATPLLLARLGRDPALGASVLLTFTTDSMGFLIFLGLATLFLLG